MCLFSATSSRNLLKFNRTQSMKVIREMHLKPVAATVRTHIIPSDM